MVALFVMPFMASAQSVHDQYVSALTQEISLLEQEVQMLVQELSNLPQTPVVIQNAPVSIVQATPSMSFGSTHEVSTPTCVDNPVLSVATSSPAGFGTLIIKYTTGCNDASGSMISLSYLMNPYTDNSGNMITGRIEQVGSYPLIQSQNGSDTSDDGINWIINPRFASIIPPGLPITVTVGSTSTTTQF